MCDLKKNRFFFSKTSMELSLQCAEITDNMVCPQSCRLGISSMKQLSVSLLSYVNLSLIKTDIICQVHVAEDMGDGIFEYFPTVYRPKTVTDLKPEKQLSYSLRILKTSTASCINVHLVVSNIERLKKFKKDLKTTATFLEEIARNLLYKFCVGKDFIISFEHSYLAKLYGISHIVIDSYKSNHRGIVDACVVTRNTSVTVLDVHSKDRFLSKEHLVLPLIGGLEPLCQELLDIIQIPFNFKTYLLSNTIQPPKGILLRGPPGTGKTSLVRYVAIQANAQLITINGPEIFGSRPGETEANLKKIFERTLLFCDEGPCILFIDEIDTLCPRRKEGDNFQERRTTAQILQFMDHVQQGHSLVIIGATNRPSALDPGLRRPGRLDKEIMMNVPTYQQRMDILKVHTRKHPVHEDLDLERLAVITNGYVGADLASLCHEAAYLALAENFPSEVNEIGSIRGRDNKGLVRMKHFLKAAKGILPSLQKGAEGLLEVSPVYWDNIGGLESTKLQIKQAVEWPVQHPEAFQRLGLPCPRGVLLYGPPGCCKTTLVRAAATSSNATFLSLSAAQLYSPFVGDSERMVSEAFHRARAGAPSIIFLDEIDSIIGKRSESSSQRSIQERVLSALLNEMDGIGVRLDDQIEAKSQGKVKEYEGHPNPKSEKSNKDDIVSVDNRNVLVVAATNRPDLLDEALMRPGRIDRILYVPPPDLEARLQILKIYTKKMPLDGVELDTIACETEFYTGADLENVCREAALVALSEDLQASVVTQEHFNTALNSITPSLSADVIQKSKELSNVSKWNFSPKQH